MDIANVKLNGITYGFGGGLTTDVKNALLNCLYQLSWETDDGDTYINALITAMDSTPLEYTGVCENYSPDGNSFSFGAFNIDFANGDYVEALVDVSQLTLDGGILLSVGTGIGTWGGYNWHITAYKDKNPTANYDTSVSAFAGTVGNRDADYMTAGTYLRLIQIKADGLYLNGTKANFGTNHANLVSYITPTTNIYIGSTQGKTRSDALYKYIRIYRGNNNDL